MDSEDMKWLFIFIFYCFSLFNGEIKSSFGVQPARATVTLLLETHLKAGIRVVHRLELAGAQMALYWVNSRLVKVTTSGRYAGSIALISTRAAPLEDTALLCHTVTSQDSRFRYHLRSFYSHVGFGLASLGQGRPCQQPPALRFKGSVDEEEESGEHLPLARLGGQGQGRGEGAGGARHVQGQLLWKGGGRAGKPRVLEGRMGWGGWQWGAGELAEFVGNVGGGDVEGGGRLAWVVLGVGGALLATAARAAGGRTVHPTFSRVIPLLREWLQKSSQMCLRYWVSTSKRLTYTQTARSSTISPSGMGAREPERTIEWAIERAIALFLALSLVLSGSP